jgi:diguanylate cyclase (GGDEF)-like protein
LTSGEPPQFLVLDMDDLKRINGMFGHVVGSRALCLLASALRLNSRNIDTAARCGGDEFALVIPELGSDLGAELWHEDDSESGQKLRVKIQADDLIVQHVAGRIADHLANDGEFPRLSVSSGAAQFPADGENIEQLVNAADQALYRNKRARKIPIPPQFASPALEGASAEAAPPRKAATRDHARECSSLLNQNAATK